MALKERSGRYSILITDDDEECRYSLRDIVEPEGFRTFLAESGEEALEIVQSEPVHLLLCDVQLPRMSGIETVQLVHQIRTILPCILVTGDVNDRLMRQAMLAKAFSVIAKPVSKNVLLYTVVRALITAYEDRRSQQES
jgi:CheY-like chemotaxis protein